MIKLLSIVIPAYNEEARLLLTLEETVAYLKDQPFDYEIIVVSDGSFDKTAEIVQAVALQNKKIKLLVNPKNMGKGYSIRKGVLASGGDCVLFMDADNSTRISELEKFNPYLDQYDIIIGSRALKGSKIVKRQSRLRESSGRLFNFFVQLFFLKGIKDTQCGFKLFKRAAAMDIFNRAKIDRFVFDVEALYLARKLKYKIAEVPVVWCNSKPSKVSFFKDFFSIIHDLVKIKFVKFKV